MHDDPFCSHVDCFTLQWSDSLNYYAFPPFSQMLQDSATITLVVPLWPNQPWFPLLLDLLVENPIILPKQLPYLPWDPNTSHPLTNSLTMISAKLSGDLCSTLAYQSKLPHSSWQNSPLPLYKAIIQQLKAGKSFVHHNRKIFFNLTP